MKGSMSATNFARAIAEGLLRANDRFDLVKCPIADGGDGTAEVLVNGLNGIFVPVEVHDPLGRKITSRFGWLPESKCAIIEMAEASGLKLLTNNELDPMIASSFGTGDLIQESIRIGAKKIILGIGGSATIDGGLGMLKAMGFLLLDKSGNEIIDGGNGLIQLAEISSKNVSTELFNCKIVIATDVANPLIGENGAANVYGPQKGATPKMIEELELGFQNYISVMKQFTAIDLAVLVGGGAAGGIALPLVSILNARIESGAELVLEMLGITNELKNYDLIITGEGCIDMQTLSGKGSGVIAMAARRTGIPVIAIGGTVKQEASSLFDGMFSIMSTPGSLEDSMRSAFNLTKELSFELGKLINVFIK